MKTNVQSPPLASAPAATALDPAAGTTGRRRKNDAHPNENNDDDKQEPPAPVAASVSAHGILPRHEITFVLRRTGSSLPIERLTGSYPPPILRYRIEPQ